MAAGVSSPRVLVTGGSGAIGRHVVTAMIARGWDVLALTHRNSIATPDGPGRLRLETGSIASDEVLDTAVAGVDAVCHLAAYIPPNYADPSEAERLMSVNALGALRVALAAAKHGKRLVACSSAQAYLYSEAPVSEDAPIYPADRATYYLASKLAGELYIEHLRRIAGLAAITFRVGSCYGPGMPESALVGLFMRAASAGEPIDVRHGGIPSADLVWVHDISRLILLAVESGDPGLYNAGSGEATSGLHLAEAVRDVFPERPVEIVVSPPRGALPMSFSALSMAKSKAMWGHEPTPLPAGLSALRAA
ncbi:MAG TPA: NAD-dependent epimerase/dehydratase family protein [Stellaceae bacterium]|jgi:nucleoside-diphosphate-sugar epimerase